MCPNLQYHTFICLTDLLSIWNNGNQAKSVASHIFHSFFFCTSSFRKEDCKKLGEGLFDRDCCDLAAFPVTKWITLSATSEKKSAWKYTEIIVKIKWPFPVPKRITLQKIYYNETIQNDVQHMSCMALNQTKVSSNFGILSYFHSTFLFSAPKHALFCKIWIINFLL